jgi:hypothetical protein
MFKTLASLVAVSICSIAYVHSWHYLWDLTNETHEQSGQNAGQPKAQNPETSRVQGIIDAKRYARIASLDLSNTQITSLDGIEFPGSLELLDLRHNQISSLKGVKFPARLQSLYLSHNLMSSLKGVVLPPELRLFHVERNQIPHFDGCVFPKYLTSLRVDEALGSVIPRALKRRAETRALTLELVKRPIEQRAQKPKKSEKEENFFWGGFDFSHLFSSEYANKNK